MKKILILLILITNIMNVDAAGNSLNSNEKFLSNVISQINSIQDNEQKVKKWAQLNNAEYYIIIDKKKCLAIVYNKYGMEFENFEVGIGKDIGDDFNDTSGLFGKPQNTTPAGEYNLIPNIFNTEAYGSLTFSLGEKANKAKNTKKVVAMHQIPKFRLKDRRKKFYDKNLSNNRMSHGCINFIDDDFKKILKYIKNGVKVYILPEEPDNKLILTKNKNGEFELIQTKY